LGFLQLIEKRMEALVEGVFGRAFRRQVHPVEIAKGLAKQMDENRMVSVTRTYAPNDFTVHLSNDDMEAIRVYQSSLRDELIQYITTHAQSKGYHLMTPPKVRFVTEDSLRFGEFGVTAKLTGGEGPREKGAPEDTSGRTRIFRTEKAGGEDQRTAAISAEEAKKHGLAREAVELVLEDKTHPLEGSGPWTIGRSGENDIVISDPNVSRRHAKLSRLENGFIVEDLGSTNGTLLDGAPIDRERIESGDELAFGGVVARFVRRTDAEAPSSPKDFWESEGHAPGRKKDHGGR